MVVLAVLIVVMGVLRVHGMRLRLAVAQQDEQRRGYALKRHDREGENEDKFLVPRCHDGAGV